MKIIIVHLSIVFVSILSCTSANKEVELPTNSSEQSERIVSLNGAITETLAALGKENEIVGRDVTSTYPTDLKAIDLGHVRSLTIEPIMATTPTLILASEKDINPDLMVKLRESGIRMELLKQEYSVQGAKDFIKLVAKSIGAIEAQPLCDAIDVEIAKIYPFEKKPKVLFIYARGANMLNVSGTGTPMDALIQIAGAENAVTGFSDFKPLTPESLIQSNPDVILMFDSGSQSLGGLDAILSLPGMSQTTAGKHKKIITMDGALMSNFGPRTGQAALELNQKLKKSLL